MFDTSTSRFSKFLLNHPDVAIHNLDSLSKKQAEQFYKFYKFLADNTVPWKVAILIDSTLQARSGRHPENAKKFNHGKGFVIGHQWTNIVSVVNDIAAPLKPIVFYSKKYCKNNRLTYKSENDLVDSGYDAKKIERAIVRKKWKFIIALKKPPEREV